MKMFVLFLAAMLFSVLPVVAETTYPFEVKITGSGKSSIIFIPGFASSGDVWNETRAVCEKDHTCYTLTMAGFAGVPAQPNPSFVQWEKSIAEYITEKKIKKPILIGHSMGGGLALAIAADYPDLISKIIVVDALPCLAAMMNPSFKPNPVNDCSSIVARYNSVPDTQFYQAQKSGMAGLLADTSKQEMVVQWSMKSDRTTFATMYCDFLNTDLREKISSIKCPALILLEPSFSVHKETMNEQYKNLKTAQIHYANKGLHFIMYDDTEWYMNEISSFIKI
ncbi:MAG: alpha/beta hydrolase [Bacteroidia bacterium]